MKVIFITELLKESGMGHFTRCHSIADAFWERKITCEFLVTTNIELFNKNENYFYKQINWIKNPHLLKQSLTDSSFVFADSYHITNEIYSIIYKYSKTPAFLDDENKESYSRGFVINGNLIAKSLNYKDKEDVFYLLGQNFQPLRKEFWDVEKRITRDEIKDILITMGGTDTHTFITLLVKEINKNFPKCQLHILSKNLLQSSLEYCKFYSNLTVEEMIELIKSCDIAISAAGQTTYELAATQTPGVLVKLAENQSLNIEGWCKNIFFDFAGSIKDEQTVFNILSFIKNNLDKEKRDRISEKLKKQFYATGSRNIVTEILKIQSEKYLTLRKASSDDLFKVFELSNDDEVRRLSFISSKIDIESHKKWFKSKITNHSTFFLVAEYSGEFVGQVRYEINDNEAVVGISISKEFRGLSLGDKILIKSAKLLSESFKEIRKIIAYIKKENIASQKSFEKAGYVFVEKEDKEYHAMKYEFLYK